MEVKAEAKFIRQSPRKMRLVAGAVKGLSVDETLLALNMMHKSASHPIKKTLESALANATFNFNIDKESLSIKSITVEEGPTLKRFRAGGRGIAKPVQKRMSHVKVVLITQAEKKSRRLPSVRRKTKADAVVKQAKQNEKQVLPKAEKTQTTANTKQASIKPARQQKAQDRKGS